MQIKLYNTLSRKIENFEPIDEKLIRIYSCGPTVYNFAHIGNLRAFLFADFLQRVIKVVGNYPVKWVMNITDIDDKTIKAIHPKSNAWLPEMGNLEGVANSDIRKFTDYYISKFEEDIKSVGIELDHLYQMPRATDYINEMTNLIQKIYLNGYAYIEGSNVYFNVSKWKNDKHYGRLKNIDFENFREGVRIDSDEYEREQVSDFVLWKEKKEGEPFWEFELDGKKLQGRPGWHLECSAMEYEILGLPFDIHTGGIDLQFPHHEDEIAQSHSGYGIDPTKYWCHNEFLEVEGKKMSKKFGNFYTLRDLIEKGYDPLDIRFMMLSQHYRTKFNFTFKGIEDAKKARNKIQEFIYKLIDTVDVTTKSKKTEEILNLKKQIFSILANDLNSPKALGELFTFINNTNLDGFSIDDRKKLLNLFLEFNRIFNVWSFDKKEIVSDVPDEIKEIADKRFTEKINKNWELADKLRNELSSLGWKVVDKKDSYELIQK